MADESPKEPGAEAAAPAKPPGAWGAILTATPIFLSILATVFAGLSSSEMTRSMYYRSLAAQQQSKAGDQWAFFQAKRIRGTSVEMTAELLRNLAHPDPFSPADLEATSAQLLQRLEEAANQTEPGRADAVARVKKARTHLTSLFAETKANALAPGSTLPRVEPQKLPHADAQAGIDAVVKAIRQRQPESATTDVVGTLQPADISEATRLAEEDADHFDQAYAPITGKLEQIRGLLTELTAAVQPLRKSRAGRNEGSTGSIDFSALDGMNTSFRLAALELDANRYRQEASFNRHVAELYEVSVRRSGFDSDRHRERSRRFFYSMLLAQLGVTVSSLALARKQRSLLWTLAALTGLAAVAFSGYVYLLL